MTVTAGGVGVNHACEGRNEKGFHHGGTEDTEK